MLLPIRRILPNGSSHFHFLECLLLSVAGSSDYLVQPCGHVAPSNDIGTHPECNDAGIAVVDKALQACHLHVYPAVSGRARCSVKCELLQAVSQRIGVEERGELSFFLSFLLVTP